MNRNRAALAATDLGPSAPERDADLVAGHEHFRQFAEGVPYILWMTTPDREGLLYINPAYERIFGRSRESLYASPRSWLDAIVPEDRERVARALQMKDQTAGYCEEFRVRRADGMLCWLRDRAVPIRDAAGRIFMHVGICEDITERRAMEAALEASGKRYEALVNSIDGIVWEADARTFAFRFVSPQAERILGYPLQRWYDPGFWAASIHPDDRGWATEYCLRSTQERRDHEFEYRMRTADGRYLWLHDHTTVIVQGGEAVLLRGVMIDVTARKRLEEQLLHAQKMEAIGRLAGGVAHDFNNILTAILGYVEIASITLHKDPALEPCLAPIRDAAQRAAQLTRQLLTFARRQMLHARSVDLAAVVRAARGMLERLLPAGIRLVTPEAADVWPVYADAAQLEQMIINLAVNARDAMPDGGVVTIELANERHARDSHNQPPLPPGEYVRMTVRDTGLGIEPDDRERIFEPFFTTKPPGQGTGLGLATAHGFVTQLGGRIDVESSRGAGTAFHVRLRRAPSDAAPAAVREPVARRGGETILLAEDDPLVHDVVKAALEARGYRVLAAREGAEALRISANHAGEIDLLLADVALPHMSGAQLRESLRSSRPRLRVLFMSGTSELPAPYRSGEASARAAVVQKPFTPDGLTAAVRRVLDQPA